VTFLANQALGGGGQGGEAFAGRGGDAKTGGPGADGFGGPGGHGPSGGDGSGGGAFNGAGATLVIAPRRGAKKNSKQAKATGSLSANETIGGDGGSGGPLGLGHGGPGGMPGGSAGEGFPWTAGHLGSPGNGTGGGLYLDPAGSATIQDTTIADNHTSTSNNDVAGTFTS
jgi:hypothetical protein